MTPENKQILINRTKSFLWRLGVMVVVAILNFIAGEAGLFELPNSVIVIIGLIVGEISKYYNVNLKQLKKEIPHSE